MKISKLSRKYLNVTKEAWFAHSADMSQNGIAGTPNESFQPIGTATLKCSNVSAAGI